MMDTFFHLNDNATLLDGKYRILKVLGQGGFGITYLALHTILDKKVAIKEFFPRDFCNRDPENSNITLGTLSNRELVDRLRVKFLKEARNIAKLDNPNIVAIQDIFEENGTAYYVMDFVEGKSLNEILKEEGKIEETTAVRYIRAIAHAVEHMHALRMNHLDIKPSNIMIRRADNQPVLIDFGTSKQYDREGEQTSTMTPGFTHGYAPMEQYRPGGVSSFSPQTDVYALGATLYTLLKGIKPPHYSEVLENGLPPLPEGISRETVEAVRHAMQIRKHERPESVSEFLKELPDIEEVIEPEIEVIAIGDTNSSKKKKDLSDDTVVEKNLNGNVSKKDNGTTPPPAPLAGNTENKEKPANHIVDDNGNDLQKQIDTLKKKNRQLNIFLYATIILLVITPILFITLYHQKSDKLRVEIWNSNFQRDKYREAYNNIMGEKDMIATNIEIRNGDDEYGETIYHSQTTYLYPRATIVTTNDLDDAKISYKLFTPDNTLSTGDVSKNGYTFTEDETYNFTALTPQTLYLSGWGNTTKGNWGAGHYTLEIWANDNLIGTKHFQIK